jgi:hypothetical protein
MRNDPGSFSTRDSMNYRTIFECGPLADRWRTAHHPTRLVVDFSNHSFHAEDSSISCRNPLKRMPSLVGPTPVLAPRRLEQLRLIRRMTCPRNHETERYFLLEACRWRTRKKYLLSLPRGWASLSRVSRMARSAFIAKEGYTDERTRAAAQKFRRSHHSS